MASCLHSWAEADEPWTPPPWLQWPLHRKLNRLLRRSRNLRPRHVWNCRKYSWMPWLDQTDKLGKNFLSRHFLSNAGSEMICFQLCCCLFETTYTFSGNSTAAFEAHSCFTSQIKKAAAATNVHFGFGLDTTPFFPHFLHTLVFSCSSSDEKVHSLCTT